MKKLITTFLLLTAAFAAYKGFGYLKKTNAAFNSKVSAIGDKVTAVKSEAVHTIEAFKERAKGETAPSQPAILAQKETKPAQGISIYLKHGGVMNGKLLAKTDEDYTVEWKGVKYVVNVRQILRVELKDEKSIEWPYKNDVVAVRPNGVAVDGKITDVADDRITMSFEEGGGSMEMSLAVKDIDHLAFAPVLNAESAKTEEHLKTLFPKMKFYREGNFTIVTDSYITWVNAYKKTLRREYTDIYLRFFKLFKDRSPNNQNFVVIFDDPLDFANYCEADLVPYWLVLGYFSPDDKVLYLYNAFGEKWEKSVFEIAATIIGRYDELVNTVKQKYNIDERYDIFIDGLMKEHKDKFWNAYNFYKSGLVDRTLSTLRHEFAHEVFHNWGLQNIILSKPKVDKEILVAKKKEFLETTDLKKKEELFKTLMNMSKEDVKDIKMEASESWLSEGIATYCGTEPPGSTDERWLFVYQEMDRKGEINPIEFLTDFKMGSFPGIVPKAQYGAYAQSWALASFLMAKYPDGFMEFQRGIANDPLKKGEDKLDRLLLCLKKDLPSLEAESRAFMRTYPQADDPAVKQFMKYEEIYRR